MQCAIRKVCDCGPSVRMIQARPQSSLQAFADAHTVRSENHQQQLMLQKAPVSAAIVKAAQGLLLA